MPHSSFLFRHKHRPSSGAPKGGFLVFLPLLSLALLALSFAYLLVFKADHYRHALRRYETFLENRYAEKSSQNLDNLYRSFDPEI